MKIKLEEKMLSKLELLYQKVRKLLEKPPSVNLATIKQYQPSSRKNRFYIYPRDKKGKYTRHTICIILIDGEMYEGVALCSEKDNFNKKIGRAISYQRAVDAYTKLNKKDIK